MTNSRALAGVALLVAMLWAVCSWYLFERRTRSGRGLERSGSHLLVAELSRRVDAEGTARGDLPFGAATSPAVVAALWGQYGDLLLEREHSLRALAELRGWTFEAFDLSATVSLDRARVTTYSPPTCRNVIRGQHRGIPFLLTDLTRARFDLGQADATPQVDLLTGTMCVIPFSAPQTLHVVSRTHWLADLRHGDEPISTESAAFNADYVVVGRNNAWTRLVLNPGFLDLLMAESITSLVIDGGQFAVAVEPWRPRESFEGLLDLSIRLHSSALTAAAPEPEEPITYFTRSD